MSSFLCFLCHSTVNADTNEDIRERYRDIVGMHLFPHSHICYICCHVLNKLWLFKSTCLKRSLEYPVLFSEKGKINMHRSDMDPIMLCNEDSCKTDIYSINKTMYHCYNSKTYHMVYNSHNTLYENDNTCSNHYVDLVKENNDGYKQSDVDNKQLNFNNFGVNDDHVIKFDVENVGYNENDDDYNSSDGYDYKNDTQDSYYEEAEENNHYENDNDNNTNDIVKEEQLIEESVLFNAELHLSNTDEFKEESTTPLPEEVDRKKSKKVKKKSYEKIVLTHKEQKAVLGKMRKEKKYLQAEFKCHSCALGFFFKDTYQSHMVRHEESNGQFSCNICGLRFATQNAKCMHTILHSELYKCNKCGVQVKRPHRSRHSRVCWKVDSDTASCHLCGKEFRDASCLQQHLKRFHASKTIRRSYSCNVCGKAYPDQGAVRTHMIKHINRRFQCDKCTSTFTSPYTLNQHKKKHENQQELDSYYCEMCNTSYSSKKSLLAHFRNTLVHQKNSYECSYCNKNCPNGRALKSHIGSHSGNKPRTDGKKRTVSKAICYVCGKVLQDKNKLNRHLKEVCERSKLEEELACYYDNDNIM